MSQFPVTIVDNFFETPSLIRNFALAQTYSKPNGNYPGFRSERLEDINKELSDHITKKIMSLFFNMSRDEISFDLYSRFQYIPSSYEEGWVHKDNDSLKIAGVVYLSPDAPVEAGTSIYEQIEPHNENSFNFRNKFYSQQDVNLDEYRIERDKHNSHFKKTLEVGNVYNRLFLYNAQTWHRESMFFGDDKESSRLTLVFFSDVLTHGTTKTPLIRSKQESTY